MSSAKELREARRRKILERGNDRLAFITGQVKALPPVEPSAVVSPPGESGLKSLSNAGQLPSSNEGDAMLDLDESVLDMDRGAFAGPLISTSSPTMDVNAVSEKLTNVRAELQSLDSTPAETIPLLSPPLPSMPALFPSLHQEDTAPATDSRTVSTSSKSRSNFNYASLGKSIDHSVAIRALLAFFVGISLVVQWTYSKCQHPFGSQNYILNWPVFLVIITDITVVLAAPFLGLVKVSSASDKRKPVDGGGLAVLRDARVEQMLAFTSQLEGALDLGLLVTKASRGLVSDISLYLVTVICAVSIVQHYQSALCTYLADYVQYE